MSQSGQCTLWSLAERIEDGGEDEEAGKGEWREGLGDWREGALDEGGVSSKPSRSKKITWERI